MMMMIVATIIIVSKIGSSICIVEYSVATMPLIGTNF